MQYVLLFLEGIITFISPCLLPMLPVYISYFAGSEENGYAVFSPTVVKHRCGATDRTTAEQFPGTRKNPLLNAIAFVAGFTAIFVLLGVFAGGIGGFLSTHETIVNIVSGAFIVVLGLGYLGVFRIPWPKAANARRVTISGPMTSALFGVVFAVAWTPCISAFLSAALLRAALAGSMLEGSFMLFVFSMGLGIPFIVSAVLLDRLRGVFDFIKKNYRVINILAGSLLIIVGILIMTGLFGRYLMLWS